MTDKKTDPKRSTIDNKAKKLLAAVSTVVRQITEGALQTRILSQEVLRGFKEFAKLYIEIENWNWILDEFRAKIYFDLLFLTPDQKKVAHKLKKMDLLKKEDRSLWDHYQACMSKYPDPDENHQGGIPPRAIKELFVKLNQIPRLMGYQDKRDKDSTVPVYETVEDIPDQLGTVTANAATMRTEVNEKKEEEKQKEDNKNPMINSLNHILNSFVTVERMIKGIRQVALKKEDQNNATKVLKSIIGKIEKDKIRINEILILGLASQTDADLQGRYKSLKELSDNVKHNDSQNQRKEVLNQKQQKTVNN